MSKNKKIQKPAWDMASACLVGVKCRFDGRAKTDTALEHRFLQGSIIPFCPELFAGFGVPREKLIMEDGEGAGVLEWRVRVFSEKGKDLSAEMVAGAEKTAAFAGIIKPETIYLKAESPSCGLSENRITGVTAALLLKRGFKLEEIK